MQQTSELIWATISRGFFAAHLKNSVSNAKHYFSLFIAHHFCLFLTSVILYPKCFQQVLGVLLVILSSVDGNLEAEYGEMKTQRHFNRAMAMRSLKMGISPRALRAKRYDRAS